MKYATDETVRYGSLASIQLEAGASHEVLPRACMVWLQNINYWSRATRRCAL